MASQLLSTTAPMFVVRLCLIGLVTICTLSGRGYAAEEAPDLTQQVAQVAQLWQSGEELTQGQLQQAIERTEDLTQKVAQSDDRQKKLLLIRLKKSLQLYRYMLQVRQNP